MQRFKKIQLKLSLRKSCRSQYWTQFVTDSQTDKQTAGGTCYSNMSPDPNGGSQRGNSEIANQYDFDPNR